MAWRTRVPELLQKYERENQRRPTQTEIAEAVDLRQPTISAWMQWGATFKRLDADVVAKLAQFFNVAPSEVYEWVEDEQGQDMPIPAAV